MSFRLLLWCIVLFFVVRFVVRFVIPLLRLTRQSAQRIRQMQEQMGKMQTPPAAAAKERKPRKDDYIEYEEVKD